MADSTVRSHIDHTPELSVLYGTVGAHAKAAEPRQPTQAEIIERDPEDIPPHATGGKRSVELIQMVSDAERELHLKGLEMIGVNEKTLEKLRRLDGLASSTAAFMAIGLEKTHRLYYLAIVDLKTVADQIKERYLDDPEAVSDTDRPFYYRNYIESVKEFGRAYDLFVQGAGAILRMVGAMDKDKPDPKRVKPEWQRTKQDAKD